MRHRPSTFSFLAIGLALAACQADAPKSLDRPTSVEVALDLRAKLGGVALGDIHPELPGLEIVAVCVDGRIVVVRRVQGRWRSEVVFQAPGELIQVACGDLVPDHPGDEILAVGMAAGDEDSGGPGAVWLCARERGQPFRCIRLLETRALQHAAVIGDLDPSRVGLEGLSAGFDQEAHLFSIAADFSVTERVVAKLPGPGKGACLHLGHAVVACSSGHVVELVPLGAGAFEAEVLLAGSTGFARPASSGTDLLVAADDGSLHWRSQDGTSHVVHRETQKLRGAVLADLDASRPGIEAATAGYEGRIVLVHRDGNQFAATDLLPEPRSAFHHLASGDVRPDRPGDELVAVGYSGEILVLSR